MDASELEAPTGRAVVISIVAASACVLVVALGASFRLPFGEGLAANAARLALVAAAGGALALAGANRRIRGVEEGAAFELAIFGAASSGAAGAALGSGVVASAPLAGALAGAGVFGAVAWGLVRVCDRPARFANLGAGLLLAAFIASAALASSFGQLGDGAAPALIAWLVGDASQATPASAGVALAGLFAALTVSLFAVRRGTASSAGAEGSNVLALVGPLALGFAFGLAGVLGFVGSFVPRTVRALAPRVTPVALLVASTAAGAASVAAIDAVPRLLIGGYALPFAVSAGMLAVPIYLLWNRARLRRVAGPMHLALEVVELSFIAAGTLVALALALFLTQIVRGAT